MNHSNRRNFLKQALVGIGSVAAFNPMTKALADACQMTPAQTEGPFYPETALGNNTDLTRVSGRNGRAKGQVIVLNGIVQDQNCVPVAGALVEIWQASESGRYQHSQDPNPSPLDPNFRYWAETITGPDGRYQFRTIVPGAYPASGTWTRPPHIHFKIGKLGYQDLITQMYFSGETLNDRDLILRSIPIEDRGSVIVDFSKDQPGDADGAKQGYFAITIQKIR